MKSSEAIVLRTYPMREADLLVTLFTRAEGKLKGVARAAMKSKRRFGGALEPLTIVRAYYYQKERRELIHFDHCDILMSPLTDAIDYERAAALAYIAEVLDQLLPEHEANDDIFRLTASVLPHIQSGHIWMPLTYFDLWLARLTGVLPELGECIVCGTTLNGSGRAYFHAMADGLMCLEHKRLASSEISADSRRLAAEMFRVPIDVFAGNAWPRSVAADLRKFLAQCLERHLEKKLVTRAALGKID